MSGAVTILFTLLVSFNPNSEYCSHVVVIHFLLGASPKSPFFSQVNPSWAFPKSFFCSKTIFLQSFFSNIPP